MAIKRVAFIVYPVSDMPRAVAFYEGLLGLKVDAGASGSLWTEFDIAGTSFAITTVGAIGEPGSGSSLALEVEDLVAFRTELAAKDLIPAGNHESPGCWMSPIQDPDGNFVILHQLKAS